MGVFPARLLDASKHVCMINTVVQVGYVCSDKETAFAFIFGGTAVDGLWRI